VGRSGLLAVTVPDAVAVALPSLTWTVMVTARDKDEA
jgi:hypothetical protein